MRLSKVLALSLTTVCALALGGIAIVGAGSASAATSWTLAGPSAAAPTATVVLSDSGSLSVSVAKGGAAVISSSPIGISTSSASFTSGLVFGSRADKDVTQSYTMVTGKQRTRSNTFKETTLAFTKGSAAMSLVVRVSNDGVSYRYVLPTSGTVTVTGESSAWTVPTGAPAWVSDTTSDDQGQWRQTTAGAAPGQVSIPALFDVGGTFVSLAESDLDGRYSASELSHSSGTGRYAYNTLTDSMSSAGPLSTPWRIATIGDLKTVAESRLVDDLAAPSKIADTSWIKPGNVAWSWLTDGVSSLSQQQKYIDFAATNGWSAILVDAGFADSWIPTLVSYGKARNVGIIVWYDSSDLQSQAQRDTILNKVKNWGAVGVKIDYVWEDNQATLKWYDTILAQTANLKLMVNFHGAMTPRGRQRTWPHVMTAEAVYGAEQKKNKAVFDTILPFTRGQISSMDFTPVTFSLSSSQRDTTDGHELGMAVGFESGWQHYGDNPGSYNSRPDALKILNRTPAAWDETRLLGGRPTQDAWFARRAGNRWSIGGISALNAKTFTTPLSFLGAGQWFGEVVTDSSGGLVRTAKTYTSADTLSVPIATRGGFASVFCAYTAGMTSCPPLGQDPPTDPPANTNLALNKPATGTAPCTATEAAPKAVNGSVSGGNSDKWCSAAVTKTLQVDLGSDQALKKLVVKHASAGGESTAYNTKDFDLAVSTDGTNWTTVATVRNNTSGSTEHVVSVSGRYIRLTVVTGVQSGGNVSRIYELEAYA